MYACIEKQSRTGETQAIYGYSRDDGEALRALERGKRRGVTWAVLTYRKSRPRGMRAGEWLPPFDDRG